MKLFISYHLADTKYVRRLKKLLDENSIDYYSVPENTDFTGIHNEEISKIILSKMKSCHILLCVVGLETYKRPHVDYELHQALKGGVGKRLGIIGLMLETRDDSINNVDLNTFPNRLEDNLDYIALTQNASFSHKLIDIINEANDKRNDKDIQVDNTRKCMKLPNKYYAER